METINKISETEIEIVKTIPEQVVKVKISLASLKAQLAEITERRNRIQQEIESNNIILIDMDKNLVNLKSKIEEAISMGVKEFGETIPINAEPLPVDEPVLPV